MKYQWRASPLHAARASVGAFYCFAIAVVALTFENPLVLGGLFVALLIAGKGADVGRVITRSFMWSLPLGLTLVVINALVTRDGITVIARLGDVPILGNLDITLEALTYGAILALRAVVITGCFALYCTCINPDEILRALRRVSFRSALTATLATRMVPVLARDAARILEAQRCRDGRASRIAVVRAVTAGALERSFQVSVTLEQRGYGNANGVRGVQRGYRNASASRSVRRRPWTRHDLAFLIAALGLLALTVIAACFEFASFAAYPKLAVGSVGKTIAFTAVLLVTIFVPFLDRRGIAFDMVRE